MTHPSSHGFSPEVKVGAVTLLSLLLLLGGIIVGKNLLARTSLITITIRSASSGGAEIASPVFVNGVKRGSITRIEPVRGGVIITASMDNISDLRRDAIARIMILEITGGRKIEIAPGIAQEPLSERDTVRGIYAGDIADLIALIGTVGTDLQTIVRRLDTITQAGTELLADGSVVSNARATLQNLSDITLTARTFLDDNNATLQTIATDLAEITRALRSTVITTTPRIEQLINQLDSTILVARTLITSGTATVQRLDGLINNLNSFISDARNGNNIIHKFIYDQEFNRRLDSTIARLQIFLDNLPRDGVNVNVRLGSRP
ncbi:MAG: MlaD family protein [Bacteroidota bacterium]|nr:MlaD family protein [Candidatus Kapabacteria bacterium]MDW8220678.1 MlaD family protein [Bacteroidota bacterium]